MIQECILQVETTQAGETKITRVVETRVVETRVGVEGLHLAGHHLDKVGTKVDIKVDIQMAAVILESLLLSVIKIKTNDFQI